jgi:hypothetical protein
MKLIIWILETIATLAVSTLDWLDERQKRNGGDHA